MRGWGRYGNALMKTDIRVAAAICRSKTGRTKENLETMAAWTRKAAKENVDMVCFPELCITGYHVREEMADAALPMDGPEVNAVIRMAGDNNIAVIAGLAEKGADGRIYATEFACDATGLLGSYRKVHLGPPEKKIFSPADAIGPLLEVNGFKFGIQLCYDAHFPELSTHMTARGADAVFIPHASPGKSAAEKKDSWMRHLPARAYDNSIFVIAVNPVGDNGHGLYFPGTALILSPEGKIMACHSGETEAMVVQTLSREMLEGIRGHRMRYFFPNRRPELY